jgi:hypothetical protein
MSRDLALVFAAIALYPIAALATPSPSPALSSVLTPPPGDYVESSVTVSSSLEGSFDPATFVSKTSTPNGTAVQQTMALDGFVDGYWRTWVQRATSRVVVEIVMAYSGGDGANKWLRSSELADKGDSNYQHSLSITGIDNYYGAHFLYKSNQSYGDAFAFAKGNDFFAIIAVSPNDDLLNTAADQTKAQYAAAPDNTIPPSEWPAQNSASTPSLAYNLGRVVGYLVIGALILGLVLLFIRRSQRRPALVAAVPGAAVQMSADAAYWWDGQVWRDAQREVPPAAQRSADGHFWWDGQRWREVP